MRRTFLAALLPALAIAFAWLSLEDPRKAGEGLAVAALAIVAALVRPGVTRVGVASVAALVAAWIAFGAQPWELAPLRDERVLAPALGEGARGIVDFYEVFLPFEPAANPEMHSLVLCAIFGFAAAVALLVAARRPLPAAAVTVAGVGWPATLLVALRSSPGRVALAAGTRHPADPASHVGARSAGRRRHRPPCRRSEPPRRRRRRRSHAMPQSTGRRGTSAGRDGRQPRSGSSGTRTTRGSRFRPRRPWCCASTDRARRTTGARRRSTSSTTTTGSSACSRSSRSTTTHRRCSCLN